jgi:tetratricopeptide (TPR) repeat protein
MIKVAAIVSAVLAAGLASSVPRDGPNTVEGSLDQYATGQFSQAVRLASGMRDVDAFVKEFERAAPLWIETKPADRRRRRLAVATFALEIADARLDAWHELRGLIEWSCQRLRQEGVPDPSEHLWQLASVALATRTGDCHWALDYCTGGGAETVNHLRHGAKRFKDDARFGLAEAMLVHGLAEREKSSSMPAYKRVASEKYQEKAMEEFGPLTGLQPISGEAELHVAQIFFVVTNYDDALEHAHLARAKSRDPVVQYLSGMISGRALEAKGNLSQATAEYRAALVAIPGAQSATIRLATLQTEAGDLEDAYALVERSFVAPVGDDPWRLFPYGDYVRFPGWIAELRRQIQP